METQTIGEDFEQWISARAYPCVAAKTALAKKQLVFFDAGDLRCPARDRDLLLALYSFQKTVRDADGLFHSFVALFPSTPVLEERAFEELLWKKLQALHELDASEFPWAPDTSSDPTAADFGFSLGGEAMFVIGMHQGSHRAARRFSHAALVFNLHKQFERLRGSGKYPAMRSAIRDRDTRFSGSLNPMLADFRDSSEARQYSGRAVDQEWQCPFQAKA